MALVKLNLQPSRRQLRQFGAIGAVAFALLAGSVMWRGHLFGFDVAADNAQRVAVVMLAGGAISGIAALVMPQGLRPLFVALSVVTIPIGFVLSYVLLFLMYFVVLTPMGLVMRAFGWDPMRRRRDPVATTYWLRRGPPPAPSRYFHQY